MMQKFHRGSLAAILLAGTALITPVETWAETPQAVEAAPIQLTLDDYTRASRFLTTNYRTYVKNADIAHHWMEGEDRFWYVRTDPTEGKQFVVVEAATGHRDPAFDHRIVAEGLAAASQRPVDPAALPFNAFRYSEDRTEIVFLQGASPWRCKIAVVDCRADPSIAPNPAEVLSPDGRWAAFLRGDNLWIRPVDGGEAFALTTDGVERYGYGTLQGVAINALRLVRAGVPTPPRVIWSPDSTRLISYRLDERRVPLAHLVQAVPDDGSVRPVLFSFPYALPGDDARPEIAPIVFDVAARAAIPIDTAPIPATHAPPFQRREAWWSEDSRFIYFLNNDWFFKAVTLNRTDAVTGQVVRLIEERSDTFVQTSPDLLETPVVRHLRNGDILWFSQKDGWGHLYRYGPDGRLKNRITRGDWTVRSIVRIDEAAGRVFFLASGREPGDVYRRYLYSIGLDGRGLILLTPEAADHGLPQDGKIILLPPPPLTTEADRSRFSPSGRYFVDTYSTPGTPPVFLVRDSAGRLIRELETADISLLQTGGYTPIETFEAMAADGTTTLYGNLHRPSNFDPTHRYPIIESIYPGPNLSRVGKNFGAALFGADSGFEAQSLAELGFIVVTVDGRGTPLRSKPFLDYGYGRPDRASDLEDHMAVLRQLAERYPYMDLDRVGIDGLSGGGYATAHALLAYPEFYKVGVSAAGNHDQLSYAAPFWDVNMGDADQPGFQTGSNLPLAGNLRGRLLLATGDMDDNVHPYLTLKLVDALIKADRDFDLLVVPNADHALSFHPYFIRRKWDYFVRNLMGGTPPERNTPPA